MTAEWLAGFFDGDGCVSDPHPGIERLQITITQKDKSVLDQIVEFLGYGKVYSNKAGFHQLCINGRKNKRAFCRLVAPHAIVKQEQLYHALFRLTPGRV